jgi:aldose sugar dehydrogenase
MTRSGSGAAGALVLLSLAAAAPVPALAQEAAGEAAEERLNTEYQPLRLVRVAGGLEHPWAVGFLPDGRLLVTERPGRLRLIDGDRATEVAGLPEIHVRSQGGLLDVVVHPEYTSNGWIYFTYSKGTAEATVPALARARLDGERLVDVEELFESNRPAQPGRHYGSRILFLDDGTLLMTIGDRGAEPARAQDTHDHSGSVVRLNADGSIPANNPYVGDARFAPEIYTYGHRNIQGLVRHPETGEIWATEHGPRGSDELNLIVAGRNYGWPDFSLGRDYRTQEQFGRREPPPGVTPPAFEFLPTLAPSGLAVVQGGGFHDAWQGNLLAGGLRAQRILRLVIEDRQVVHAEELLLHRVGRVRDVRQGPDGHIYVVSDEADGALYRVEAVQR